MRSAFAPAVLSLAALIAALVRWWLQGSNNLYTAIDKRFYIPDPDLGWRIGNATPIWLGLEVCAILAAMTVGLTIGGWLIQKLESRRGREHTVLRLTAWATAAVSPAVPILAFLSGGAPANARDTLPATAASVGQGIAGGLDLPAGRYEVVAHQGTSITAQLSAGGETFDARFTDEVHGSWNGDPGQLDMPMTANLTVAAKSVDTGISGRTKTAREYLQVERFPTIGFALDKLIAATQEAPDRVAFRAKGSLDFIGTTLSVDVTGTLRKPDDAALARLGVAQPILLATADFSISIRETPLVSDARDFDDDRIPIHVSLVLRHTGG